MATAAEIRADALAQGRKLKGCNTVTALLCGAVPGLILSRLLNHSSQHWALGILIGLIWANAFEYFYHRFLLHWPVCAFGKAHLLHHLTTGTPLEPEHVTFGSSPLWVAALFFVNGALAVVADWRLGLGLAPGILSGYTIYMIAVEEMHWRIHLGGWLPPGLVWTRKYHLAHHDIPSGRYNVFFPVFDLLFGNIRPRSEETHAAEMAAGVVRSEWVGRQRVATWKFAVMMLWLAGVAIGARYFWSARTRV